MTERTVLAVTGTDRLDFLQGLVTNDVTRAKDGPVYTALLTPQGKFLFDFFVLAQGEALWIDVATDQAPALLQRLTMYRLRADVQIAATDIIVSRGLGDGPDGSFADPRDPGMGWRSYGPKDISEPVDWDAQRVAHVVPQTGVELGPDSYILEMGFERLSGVDFRKGCFVGQEIVARMKHKTSLRKGLARVQVEGKAAPGTEITAGGRTVGVLHTQADGQALAYLRFDRATDDMRAGIAIVRYIP